jgi:hypothetical protein
MGAAQGSQESDSSSEAESTMKIYVNGRNEEGAVSWSVDEAGVLDLYSANGVVMCSIHTWDRVDRVLEGDETWETYRPQINIDESQARDGAENLLRGVALNES